MGIKYLAPTGVAMEEAATACEATALTRLHGRCTLPRHATQRVLQPRGDRTFAARRLEGRDFGGAGRPASNRRTVGRNAVTDSPATGEPGLYRSRPRYRHT